MRVCGGVLLGALLGVWGCSGSALSEAEQQLAIEAEPPTRLALAQAAAAESPTSAEASGELASAQLEAEDWPAAAASADRALELAGDTPRADDASTLGQALVHDERYDDAQRAFARALAVEPGRTADRLRLARVEEHLEHTEAAEAAYRRVIEEDEDDVEGRMHLGGMLTHPPHTEERIAEARRILAEALERLPPDDTERRAAVQAYLTELDEQELNSRLAVEEAQAQVEQMLLEALGPPGALDDVLAGEAVTDDASDVMEEANGVGITSGGARTGQEVGAGGRMPVHTHPVPQAPAPRPGDR